MSVYFDMAKRMILITYFIFFYISSSFSEDKNIEYNFVTLEWPPYVGKDLYDNGLAATALKKALRKSRTGFSIHYRPWVRALKEAGEGEYHGIFPAYYSGERSKDFYFSDPIMKGPVGFYKKKSTNLYYDGNIKSLQQYKIGLVRGYVNSILVDKTLDLKKDFASSDEENLKKLCANRVELIVIDFLVAKYLIDKMAKEGEIGCIDLEEIGPPLENKELYLLIPKKFKNAKILLEKVNEGLK
ncbi:ABC transporter, substrate-binding protein, family 3 [Bacteriovorax sp. BSW11_IV]|uniref:substrate-binding periplasmic protein n=1 Tax=Bacteriovorax sp. BSW11_IV TaxID=1353529 RepID=UPI00038A1DF2|nr:transporter substrate-binding domain-containing protein [Bacteriovorax sp. BSW11_IV]EQC46737.1 ABC transporter, substrate-binding protein, family 3 [Bacteriovorax sp. BSW11_IV]